MQSCRRGRCRRRRRHRCRSRRGRRCRCRRRLQQMVLFKLHFGPKIASGGFVGKKRKKKSFYDRQQLKGSQHRRLPTTEQNFPIVQISNSTYNSLPGIQLGARYKKNWLSFVGKQLSSLCRIVVSGFGYMLK